MLSVPAATTRFYNTAAVPTDHANNNCKNLLAFLFTFSPNFFIQTSVHNLCFVFEEGSPHHEDKPRELDVTCLSNANLVHVVFPSCHQVYLAKTAVDWHYQSIFADIAACFRSSGGKVRVKIYMPDVAYSNDFLEVIVGSTAEQNIDDFYRLYKDLPT
jgi:hypothetical protein